MHLSKDAKKYFVQVSIVAIVRESFGVIAGAGVKGGFVVTSGDFIEEDKAFAKGKQRGLINGTKLDKMIRSV